MMIKKIKIRTGSVIYLLIPLHCSTLSEDDVRSLVPAVSLPANISQEGLGALVNKLS